MSALLEESEHKFRLHRSKNQDSFVGFVVVSESKTNVG
jgi:hypothetical protein